MAVAARSQTSLYETTIEDAELERLLEQRETRKDSLARERKAYNEANDEAKAKLKALDLADAPVRVGRFVVSETPVASRSVSFETAPTTRLHIRLLPAEE